MPINSFASSHVALFLAVTFPAFPSILPYSGSASLSMPPPPHRFFHFSFPVDAASCLGYAGALEQAAGQFNGSCLSQTAPVLTRPIWQCGSGYTELTERVTLLDLDFASPFSDLQGKSTARSASPHCLPLLTQQGLVQTDCM